LGMAVALRPAGNRRRFCDRPTRGRTRLGRACSWLASDPRFDVLDRKARKRRAATLRSRLARDSRPADVGYDSRARSRARSSRSPSPRAYCPCVFICIGRRQRNGFRCRRSPLITGNVSVKAELRGPAKPSSAPVERGRACRFSPIFASITFWI
jgi:hypothetical protein